MSIVIKTDCLDDAIGLTRTDCDCFQGAPTEDIPTNLWLDEIEGMNLRTVEAATDCSVGNIWELLRKAREQAINTFKTDYTSAIARKWQRSRQDFKGIVGDSKASAILTLQNYQGHRYIFPPVKSGVFIIKRIGLLMAGTGDVTVRVYNSKSSVPLATITCPVIADTLSWKILSTPLELPMQDDEKQYLEYFVLYENPSFNAYLNTFKCCSAVLNYSCIEPLFDQSMNDYRYLYARWCNVTGAFGASVDAIQALNASFNNAAQGMLVDADMRCDIRGIACKDLNYRYSDIAMVKAYTVYYRAGVNLCESILSSSEINRYTMLDRDRLAIKRNQFAKEYNNRIDWLTDPDNDLIKTSFAQDGCLSCLKRMNFGSVL